MKNLVAIAILFFVGFTTQAQDKKAKALLDEVTAKIKSYDNFSKQKQRVEFAPRIANFI